MKSLGILGLVLLVFLVANDASPLNKKKFSLRERQMVMGRLSHGLVPKGKLDPNREKKSVEDYFTSMVDNFDDSNTATYQQVRNLKDTVMLL